MSTWLIGLAGAAALLMGFLLLRRRAPGTRSAADSSAPASLPAAALAAAEPEEAEPAAPPSTEILSVRAETLRSLRELAFGTGLPAVGAIPPPVDQISVEIGAALEDRCDVHGEDLARVCRWAVEALVDAVAHRHEGW